MTTGLALFGIDPGVSRFCTSRHYPEGMTIMDNRVATIHGRLRAARIFAGVEQIDLARELGVSRTSVSNYETGKSEPVASVFVRWAAVTGVSLDWLAGVNAEDPDSRESGSDVRPKGFEPLAFCSVVSLLLVVASMGPRARS